MSSYSKYELIDLIEENFKTINPKLKEEAVSYRLKYYGKKVYIRGLIEFTNYCKNDCYYCGIRKSNLKVNRYRLTKAEILDCCENGNRLGFNTFVLQGGEDLKYSERDICDIVYSIKSRFPHCAVTLSIGEKSYAEYKAYFESGADRFLLRHETALNEHYKRLHPSSMSLENRKKCLWNLKEIGYQVGAGFMVGSPFQTSEALAEDLMFLYELQPEMIGIGPFIPHHETPFKESSAGGLNETLAMLVLSRIMVPKALIPATTALNTISENGRRAGFEHGANVIMPNLSPLSRRNEYSLYDNKAVLGLESAYGIDELKKSVEDMGYEFDLSRGDNIEFDKSALKN